MKAQASEIGRRVQYRVYATSPTLSVDDSSVTTEKVRCGTIVGEAARHVRVRDDASGRVVNVLHHRIVNR
jgi:hypothetical protein